MPQKAVTIRCRVTELNNLFYLNMTMDYLNNLIYETALLKILDKFTNASHFLLVYFLSFLLAHKNTFKTAIMVIFNSFGLLKFKNLTNITFS